MNTSKIKGVQAAGTWKPGDGSELFKFEYHMEDGTILTAFHKTNAPIAQQGEEVEYEVTKTSSRGKSGKVRKPGQGGGRSYGGGGQRDYSQIGRQWAINAASEFLTSTSVDPSKLNLQDVAANAAHLELMSKDFDAYIAQCKEHMPNPSDDLPF